jgi:hypothetical protein
VYCSKPFIVARLLCCLFLDLIWRNLLYIPVERETLFRVSLEKKFAKKLWHGLTRKAAFIEAGFDFDVYDIFYRPMSEMIHAEPSLYVMRDHDDAWVFGRSDLKEIRYLAGAYVSSSDLLLVGMEQINQGLSLPFGERLAANKKSFFEFVPKYKAALLSVKDGEGGPILRGLKIATRA